MTVFVLEGPMDSDILAADRTALEKITAQDMRDWLQSGALTLRQRVGLAIADKYMTTSTGVGATATTDAINDAARLKVAIDEVLKVL